MTTCNYAVSLCVLIPPPGSVCVRGWGCCQAVARKPEWDPRPSSQLSTPQETGDAGSQAGSHRAPAETVTHTHTHTHSHTYTHTLTHTHSNTLTYASAL